MTLEVAVRGRGKGKTTDLLEWVRQAPDGEKRVLITFSEEEARRLRSGNRDLGDWQIISYDASMWRDFDDVVMGIDNLDIILGDVFSGKRWRVGVVTLTGEPFKLEDIECLYPDCRRFQVSNEALGAALAYCYRKYPELREEAVAYVKREHPEHFPGAGS